MVCPFFALLNFLGGKLTFQFGPTLGISGSLPLKDNYLISSLTLTNVDQDVGQKPCNSTICEWRSVNFPKHEFRQNTP
jgi:hypothetical protein